MVVDHDFSPEISRNIGFIEGDIIPSDQDIAEMEEKLRAGGERARRAAPVTTAKLWDKTKPIPFKIDHSYTETEKTLIRTILKRMTDNTCLTFEENIPGKPVEYFMERNEGDCYSDLGDQGDNVIRHPENKNNLTRNNACPGFRSYAHAVLKTDRDDNLEFDDKNIKEGYRNNFDKHSMYDSETNYGIPYEFSSIMHYPPSSAFQIDPSTPALLPKDVNYIKTVFGTYPIFNDWKMINVHYKCNEICSTQIDCQNGGYQHPRLCSECVCPQFHHGTRCEEERDVVTLKIDEPTSISHGFTLNVTVVNSPDYNYTIFERSPARLIKSPEGTRIRVTIEDIHDSEIRQQHFCPVRCDMKAVEIVDGDLTRVGKRFCCDPRNDKTVNSTFVSATNVVGLVFFTRPGLDFTANVTFSVEGEPVSPTNQTGQPPTTTVPTFVKPETPDSETEELSSTSQTEEPETEETQTEEPEPLDNSGEPEAEDPLAEQHSADDNELSKTEAE